MRRYDGLKDWFATMATAFIVAAVFGIGSFFLQPVWAQSTALWPQVTVANVLTASSTQLIGTNYTRHYLSICNPSSGVTVWIAPGSQAAVANGGGSLSIAPVSSNVTSCFTTPIIGSLSMGQSWNAIAVTTPTSLTVLEY